MRTLVLDGGNTRLSGAVCADGHWEAAPWQDIPTSLLETSEFSRRLADNLANLPELPVVLVSVLPALTERLLDRLPDLRLADHRCALPFKSRVPDLAAVGSDRLCNLAAAVDAGLTAALVVDLGTATTFDVLRGGEFLGGLIAPGMAFAARALGQAAARLEPVEFRPCPLELGLDTTTAMANGAWLVGSGGVLATVEDLTETYGLSEVVLTGGLGVMLAGPGRRHDPLWTLRGALSLCPA